MKKIINFLLRVKNGEVVIQTFETSTVCKSLDELGLIKMGFTKYSLTEEGEKVLSKLS